MGNSATSGDGNQSVDDVTKLFQTAYDMLREGNAHVGQDQFQRLFSCLPANRCALLWQKLFGDIAGASLPDYTAGCSSLDQLRRDEDRLRFALTLARSEKGQYIDALVCWCAAAASISEEEAAQLSAAFAANFTPVEEGEQPSEDAFVRWANRNCAELAHDLWTCLRESLRFGHLFVPSIGALRPQLANSALTVPRLWLLSNCVSDVFKHHQRREGAKVLDRFNLDKMGHVQKLFDSFEHGMSSNRFRNLIFGYEAPTLTVIEFKEQSYCLALDVPFKEHWDAYGGAETKFFSLRPKFCLLLSGVNLCYSNFTTKSGKRSLAVGRSAVQAPVVECEEGLAKGAVYGLRQELVRLEVWGCGRDPEGLARKLAEQKAFDQRDAAKQRNRKLKAEAWEDSPDRLIMDWGGVQAKNSDLVGGPEDE